MKLILKRLICYVLFFCQVFPAHVFASSQTVTIDDFKKYALDIAGTTHQINAVYLNHPEDLGFYQLKFDQSLTQAAESLFFLDAKTGQHLGTLQNQADATVLAWHTPDLVAELFGSSAFDVVIQSDGKVKLTSETPLNYSLFLNALDCDVHNLRCPRLVANAKQKLTAGGKLGVANAALFGGEVVLQPDLVFAGATLRANGQVVTTSDGLQVLASQSIRLSAPGLGHILGSYEIKKDSTDTSADAKDHGFFADSTGEVVFAENTRLALDHGVVRLNGEDVYVSGQMQETATARLTLQVLAKKLAMVRSPRLLARLAVKAPAQELQEIPEHLELLTSKGGKLTIFNPSEVDDSADPEAITHLDRLIIDGGKASIRKRLWVKAQTVVNVPYLRLRVGASFHGTTLLQAVEGIAFGKLRNPIDVDIEDGVIRAGERFFANSRISGRKLAIFAKVKDVLAVPNLAELHTVGEILTLGLFSASTGEAGRIGYLQAHESRFIHLGAAKIGKADLFSDDCSIAGTEIEDLNAQVGALFARDLTAHVAKVNASRDAMLVGAKGEVLRLIAGGTFNLSGAKLQSVQAKAAAVDVEHTLAREIHVEAMAGDANLRHTTVDSALLQAAGVARATDVTAERTLELSGHDTAILSSSVPQAYLTAEGGAAQVFGHKGEMLVAAAATVRIGDSRVGNILANAAGTAVVHEVAADTIAADAKDSVSIHDAKAKVVSGSADRVDVASVAAAQQTYEGKVVTLHGRNTGKVEVTTQHLGAHGTLDGALKAKTGSAVISQATHGELEVDADGEVILAGPTTGESARIRAASNHGILINPRTKTIDLSLGYILGGEHLLLVDASVAEVVVRQTSTAPLWLRKLMATARSTTIVSAGDIDGRRTRLDSTGDLRLVSGAKMGLQGAKGTIAGTFTRAVGVDADFSDTNFEAAKVTSLVEGDANFTRAAERAPVIEHHVKGRAELTGASFIAKMMQSGNPTQATLATQLLFLAGEITGAPTVVRDGSYCNYQERIERRPTFICDGRTVVLAERLFHLVAPHIKAGPDGLTYGAVNGNAYTPAQPLERLVQWVSESTSSSGWGPFSSSETTTQSHTERSITHAVAHIESAGPTQAVTDKTTGTLVQPGVYLNSQGLFEFIGAQAYFPAVMNTMQHDVLSRTETSGFLSMGYSSEGGSSMFHARAQGGTFILPNGARFNGANVLMECPHIESPFFDLGGGRLRLALGRDHFQFQTWEKEEDLFWRSVSQRASYDLTYVMPTIVGELEVRNGHVDIEVVANRSKAFSEQIKLVHSTQELNWLIERHVYEAFEAGGPTAALAVMVAIAATIVTAGAGAGLGLGLAGALGQGATVAALTTTGSVIQGMVIGAVSSLASQSAMAAINNRPVLQALTSREGMKNLFCSMASAGISKGVCHKFGLSLTPDAPKEVPLSMSAVANGVVKDVAANSISLTQHLSYHAVNSGVGAAVHIAAGDRVDTTLRNAAIATVTDTLASFGGAHITESVRGSFGRGVLEVGLNAGTGFIKDGGKGAFGGAIGAGVASLCTSATDLDAEEAEYRKQHPNASATEVNEHLAQSQRASHAITQILGAAVAMFAEADVNAASSAARNVTEQHIRAHYLDCMAKSVAADAAMEEILDEIMDQEQRGMSQASMAEPRLAKPSASTVKRVIKETPELAEAIKAQNEARAQLQEAVRLEKLAEGQLSLGRGAYVASLGIAIGLEDGESAKEQAVSLRLAAYRTLTAVNQKLNQFAKDHPELTYYTVKALECGAVALHAGAYVGAFATGGPVGVAMLYTAELAMGATLQAVVEVGAEHAASSASDPQEAEQLRQGIYELVGKGTLLAAVLGAGKGLKRLKGTGKGRSAQDDFYVPQSQTGSRFLEFDARAKVLEATVSAKKNVPYAGIKEASKYLSKIGIPHEQRAKILQSFESGTVNLKAAGASEYGLRFYDGVEAMAAGRYLFETFPASRESLAISTQWNQMANLAQWQIRPGSLLIEGRAAPQGIGLSGGQNQKFVPNLGDLLIP